MFPVDLRALRAPHGLARRVQPALSAVRPSVLSVTQRPNTSPRHKIDRAFAAKKPSSQHAHTLERASRFPSASCALLPRSFARVQLPTPFFSCAPTLFSKNTGGGVSRRKSCLHSNELRTLQNANDGKEPKRHPNKLRHCAATIFPTPDAATASLCYCFWSPARQCVARLTHH